MSDPDPAPPPTGEWQAQLIRRLTGFGLGFAFGPGTNWWPTNHKGEKIAGPFISTAEFDAWLDAIDAIADNDFEPIIGKRAPKPKGDAGS